jgi:hypothetical protein
MGRPHKRILWLDITSASHPVLVWNEGDAKDADKVKDKDRLPLIDIVDIKAGQSSTVLNRSGKKEHADRYMSFAGDARTLDIELPTPEARDWVFKKFADLFQAYATAQLEHLTGDAVTLRVMDIMDNGASAEVGSGGGGGGDVGGAAGRMDGGDMRDGSGGRGARSRSPRGRSPGRGDYGGGAGPGGGGGYDGMGASSRYLPTGGGGGGGGGGMAGMGRMRSMF